jgi:hypothetical protein
MNVDCELRIRMRKTQLRLDPHKSLMRLGKRMKTADMEP